MRRKGELSSAAIDRDWPHQVALPASASHDGGYAAIREFCRNLSPCPRGHSVLHGDEWWNVYCFAEREHAEKFLLKFVTKDLIPGSEAGGASGRSGESLTDIESK
jgi:hypothetical protein